MVGCLGTGKPQLDGLELSLTLAKKLNGTFCNVYAPVYVESELVQSYLLKEPSIAQAVRYVRAGGHRHLRRGLSRRPRTAR